MESNIYKTIIGSFLTPIMLLTATAQDKVIEMNKGNQVSQYDYDNDGIVKARDRISLLPGFSYDASPDASLRVDEDMICPVNYLASAPDPDERDITANPVVGAINGNFDVTPSGAATYTIPINVPPGTNGMQPNLNLVYNNQSGNGILGKGWTIKGISAITRTSTTIYNDGFIDGVDFDNNDKFAFRGK